MGPKDLTEKRKLENIVIFRTLYEY